MLLSGGAVDTTVVGAAEGGVAGSRAVVVVVAVVVGAVSGLETALVLAVVSPSVVVAVATDVEMSAEVSLPLLHATRPIDGAAISSRSAAARAIGLRTRTGDAGQ